MGWRDPWIPLTLEGAVVAAVVGGWRGALLAPLPFLLTPETVRWLKDALLAFQQGDRFVSFVALVYLVPLLLVVWAGGVVGAIWGWLVWARKRRGPGFS